MKNKAFTLIELLIVLSVICGLMFLITPNIAGTKDKIDKKTCAAYVELVNAQILAYYAEHDEYPAETDGDGGLAVLKDEGYIKDPKNIKGCQIEIINHIAKMVTDDEQ